VAHLWSEHTNLKRIGLTLCFWSGPLYATFMVALWYLLRRNAPRNQVLNVGQLALGIFGTVFVTVNFLILLVVAFRPDRDPDSLQALHDLGFIMSVMPAAPFTFQYFLIGLAILQNRSAEPLIPRWVGYLNFWVAILFVPAAAVPFFTHGILAWNGLLGFWIPGVIFAVWMWAMFWAMYRAVGRVPDDEVLELDVSGVPALSG
jgi:hypothetical protein